MDRPSGHFICEGFSRVRLVFGSLFRGLKDEIVGREAFVEVDNTADDGEMAWDLRLEELGNCGGEGVFRAFRRLVLIDLRLVGVDGSLIFGCDGLDKGSWFLCLGLCHACDGWEGREGLGGARKNISNSIKSVEFMLVINSSGLTNARVLN